MRRSTLRTSMAEGSRTFAADSNRGTDHITWMLATVVSSATTSVRE